MTSKKCSLQNEKKKTRAISIMDKELDESLQEIIKILGMSAWINLIAARAYCKTPADEDELEHIHQIMDSIMSKWTFQQELK